MEENQNTSLFGLGIDPAAKAHLAEAARWARFLAIVGFIMCGLVVVVGIFAGSIFGTMASSFGGTAGLTPGGVGFSAFFAVIYIVMALVIFFPYLFLFRFANKMKTALVSNDQTTLNTSFQNLKIMFRYVGIVTIIGLAFYAIIFLIAILGAGLTR